jgi:hypothetical protein
MGKAKLEQMSNLQDTATILALNHDYCTVEPYIETKEGVRVQKIGDSYRVYRKIFTGSGWKSQFGGADLQEIELTDTFKLWADECSKCYGGMELLAVDAVMDLSGNYHILELNGTAIGIQPRHWSEDSQRLVHLVIQRMNQIFCNSQLESQSQPTETSASPAASEWIHLNKMLQSYEKENAELKELLKKGQEKPKETGLFSSFF